MDDCTSGRAMTIRNLAVVVPLAIAWLVWQLEVRHIFAHSRSEFYARIPLNITFFLQPQAWPQLLGGCCYLLPIVLVFRGYLRDARLRAWLWVLPPWFAFMFVYGILIETRIFGELIPFIAVAGALMAEGRIGAPSTSRRRKVAGGIRDHAAACPRVRDAA